jgi:glycosyltransferase involved in cell wall biosynthesis
MEHSSVRVTHLTSVHPRFDTRVFFKECVSLAKKGYLLSLVVADGLGDELKERVQIYDVGKSKGRWSRILRATQRVYEKALELDADIYHLHDPELLPIGLKLKKRGKKVIFDAHEDFPKQLLGKPYLHKFIKKPLSQVAGWYESAACKKLDAVVAATPHIRDKFSELNSRVEDINNFPILGELVSGNGQSSAALTSVCYVGGMAEIRGIKEMVAAMASVKPSIKLTLAGKLEAGSLRNSLEKIPAWQQVDALGFLDREQVRDVYASSFSGLVVLHPIINYLDALPVKMFEYMSAGLPVIASNFPLWKEIIMSADCGVCVDPLNPEEIAEAINYFYENPEVAQQMGLNGQKAVLEKYNWQQEEQKLFYLYEELSESL